MSTALPSGARQLLVAARSAGGWFCWVDLDGVVRKQVRVATRSEDGETRYAERLLPRCLVKGIHPASGRRFVALWAEGKAQGAYWWTREHSVSWEGEEAHWTSDTALPVQVGVAALKRLLVPQT